MLRLKNYVMDRHGEVRWKVHGPNHCGTVNHLHGGHIPIRWHIRLCCENSLDSQGFLVDNMALKHFIDGEAAVSTDMSCEQLLTNMAHKLQVYLATNEPSLRIDSFSISFCPEPYEAEMIQNYGIGERR